MLKAGAAGATESTRLLGDGGEPRSMRTLVSIIMPALLGNTLEFYELGVYAVLAPLITDNFFEEDDKHGQAFGVWYGFAASFIVRPLGGYILGTVADRHGRRASLLMSLGGMVVCTTCIGLLPTRLCCGESWGSFGLALLLIFKVGQGLSVAGELSTVMTLSAEHAAPAGLIGFAIGLCLATICVGYIISVLLVLLLEHFLTEDQMLSWGWRLPFLLVLPWGVFAALLRFWMKESPAFTQGGEHVNLAEDGRGALRTLCTHHRRPLLLTIGISGLGGAMMYGSIVLPRTFLVTAGVVSETHALGTSLAALTILVISYMVHGVLSDRIGAQTMAWWFALSVVACNWPLWVLMVVPNTVWTAYAAMALLGWLAGGNTPVGVLVMELFPTSVRATGLGLGWNIAQAIFASLAPFVGEAAWLAASRGSDSWLAASAPAAWPIFAALVTLGALWMLRRSAQQSDGATSAKVAAEKAVSPSEAEPPLTSFGVLAGCSACFTVIYSLTVAVPSALSVTSDMSQSPEVAIRDSGLLVASTSIGLIFGAAGVLALPGKLTDGRCPFLGLCLFALLGSSLYLVALGEDWPMSAMLAARATITLGGGSLMAGKRLCSRERDPEKRRLVFMMLEFSSTLGMAGGPLLAGLVGLAMGERESPAWWAPVSIIGLATILLPLILFWPLDRPFRFELLFRPSSGAATPREDSSVLVGEHEATPHPYWASAWVQVTCLCYGISRLFLKFGFESAMVVVYDLQFGMPNSEAAAVAGALALASLFSIFAYSIFCVGRLSSRQMLLLSEVFGYIAVGLMITTGHTDDDTTILVLTILASLVFYPSMYLAGALCNSHPLLFTQPSSRWLSKQGMVTMQEIIQTPVGTGLGMFFSRVALYNSTSDKVELARLGWLFLAVMLVQSAVVHLGWEPQRTAGLLTALGPRRAAVGTS